MLTDELKAAQDKIDAKKAEAKKKNDTYKGRYNLMSRHDRRVHDRHLLKQKRGKEYVAWLHKKDID